MISIITPFNTVINIKVTMLKITVNKHYYYYYYYSTLWQVLMLMTKLLRNT